MLKAERRTRDPAATNHERNFTQAHVAAVQVCCGTSQRAARPVEVASTAAPFSLTALDGVNGADKSRCGRRCHRAEQPGGGEYPGTEQDSHPAARRALTKLPIAVAAALYEHAIGPVADNPHRLGKSLDEPYDEVWSTRRGEYRVLYTIYDGKLVVMVVAVSHSRDTYRPR